MARPEGEGPPKEVPVVEPLKLIAFVLDVMEEYGTMMAEIGGLEEKYGISFGSLGAVLQGDPFRLMVGKLDPKALGRFIQFIFELTQVQPILAGNWNALSGAQKIEASRQIRDITARYQDLREMAREV